MADTEPELSQNPPEASTIQNSLAIYDTHHAQLWRVSGDEENSKSVAIKRFVDEQREALRAGESKDKIWKNWQSLVGSFSDYHKVLATAYCYVHELVKEVKNLEDPTILKEVEKENPTWIMCAPSMYSAIEQMTKLLNKTKQRWQSPRAVDFSRIFMDEPCLGYDPLKLISVLSKNIDSYHYRRTEISKDNVSSNKLTEYRIFSLLF
jgi:hypothetical protein